MMRSNTPVIINIIRILTIAARFVNVFSLCESSVPRKISKRLETIDGVEIASSYKEYLDLALSDLDDRLKKSGLKLTDFQDRIDKRSNLLSEIAKEIAKRKEFSIQLSEKDKILRTRLLRNTEMKSALQNLADIAGYKLSSTEKEKFYSDLNANRNAGDDSQKFISDNITYMLGNKMNDKEEDSAISVSPAINAKISAKISNSSSYTRYIEMAYAEVEAILVKDKQTLIEVIRSLKTNELKLKELEQLKSKVNASLKKLKIFHSNLINIIHRDKQIETTVQQLEDQIKFNIDALNDSILNTSNNNNNNNNNTNTSSANTNAINGQTMAPNEAKIVE